MPQIKDSLYEQLNPLTTIAGQHFVEDFSGDTLDTFRWTETDVAGTNTFAMADEVDGGFKISTGGANNDAGTISFNNKRPFSYNGSEWISVWKNNQTSSIITKAGLSSTTSIFGGDYALCGIQSGASYFDLRTRDGTTASGANSSVAVDTSFHTFKMTLNSSNIVLSIDGVAEVVDTTNLPDTNMQAGYYVNAQATAVKDIQTKYCEVWNT